MHPDQLLFSSIKRIPLNLSNGDNGNPVPNYILPWQGFSFPCSRCKAGKLWQVDIESTLGDIVYTHFEVALHTLHWPLYTPRPQLLPFTQSHSWWCVYTHFEVALHTLQWSFYTHTLTTTITFYSVWHRNSHLKTVALLRLQRLIAEESVRLVPWLLKPRLKRQRTPTVASLPSVSAGGSLRQLTVL